MNLLLQMFLQRNETSTQKKIKKPAAWNIKWKRLKHIKVLEREIERFFIGWNRKHGTGGLS